MIRRFCARFKFRSCLNCHVTCVGLVCKECLRAGLVGAIGDLMVIAILWLIERAWRP